MNTKAGFVAIIGEPNAGKSTFLNTVLGQKLSIVTRKPQTTRKKISGIFTCENLEESEGGKEKIVGFQVVFLDTPGIIIPKYGLHEEMMKHADQAIEDADAVLLLVDACSLIQNKDIQQNLAFLKVAPYLPKKKCILAINKIDLAEQTQIQQIYDSLLPLGVFAEIIPFSALLNENTQRVVHELVEQLPYSPFFFDPEDLSTETDRFFVSEFVREKIFERYAEEMPYATETMIEEFSDRPNGKTFIRIAIIVERPSQKAIIIGNQGQAIKHLGIACRREIESFLGREVYLELFVKVRKDWRKNANLLKSFGY